MMDPLGDRGSINRWQASCLLNTRTASHHIAITKKIPYGNFYVNFYTDGWALRICGVAHRIDENAGISPSLTVQEVVMREPMSSEKGVWTVALVLGRGEREASCMLAASDVPAEVAARVLADPNRRRAPLDVAPSGR
jgi:hypothetical protein